MPITIQWDDEDKSTLRYDYEGQWTWDDLYAVIAEANEMLEGVPYQVVAIINMQNSGMLPQNPLAHGKRLYKIVNPHVDLQIVVGANSFTQIMADIIFRAYRKLGISTTTRFVETLDEARALADSRLSTDA